MSRSRTQQPMTSRPTRGRLLGGGRWHFVAGGYGFCLFGVALVAVSGCQKVSEQSSSNATPAPAKVGSVLARLQASPQNTASDSVGVEQQMHQLLGAGQVSEAFQLASAFCEAQKDGPQASEAYRILGNFYIAVRAHAEALSALEKAVTVAPDSGTAWRDLARARERFPNAASTSKALEAVDKALQSLPQDPDVLLTKARLLKRIADPETTKWFASAVRAAPERPEAHREYAEWLVNIGKSADDFTLALQEAELSRQADPKSPLGQMLVGQAHLRLKQPQEAVEPLKRAAVLSPNVPRPASLLAEAYQMLGNSAESRRWRQDANKRTTFQSTLQQTFAELTTRPADRRLLAKMSQLLGTHGEIGEAIRYKAMSLDAPPDSATVLRAVASDLRAGGYIKAAQVYEERAHERE